MRHIILQKFKYDGVDLHKWITPQVRICQPGKEQEKHREKKQADQLLLLSDSGDGILQKTGKKNQEYEERNKDANRSDIKSNCGNKGQQNDMSETPGLSKSGICKKRKNKKNHQNNILRIIKGFSENAGMQK